MKYSIHTNDNYIDRFKNICGKKILFNFVDIGNFGMLYNEKDKKIKFIKTIYKRGEVMKYSDILGSILNHDEKYNALFLKTELGAIHYSNNENMNFVFNFFRNKIGSAYVFFKEELCLSDKIKFQEFDIVFNEMIKNDWKTENTKVEEVKTEIKKFNVVRDFIKLAKIINNTGLKLVKNNLYPFMENPNNSNYIIIDGINVNKNRVKFIDVYETPPI